jgi:hypothetical protein
MRVKTPIDHNVAYFLLSRKRLIVQVTYSYIYIFTICLRPPFAGYVYICVCVCVYLFIHSCIHLFIYSIYWLISLFIDVFISNIYIIIYNYTIIYRISVVSVVSALNITQHLRRPVCVQRVPHRPTRLGAHSGVRRPRPGAAHGEEKMAVAESWVWFIYRNHSYSWLVVEPDPSE